MLRRSLQRLMSRSLVAVTIACGLVAPTASPIATARQAETAAAGHPVVGAWFWQNISDDPFDDSYAVFGGDGTYVEETAYIGAGIGSWHVTGDHTADLIIVFQDIEGGLDPDAPAAFVLGTLKFWLSLEVSPDERSLTATGPVEARKADGTLEYAFTFNGTATRLGLDDGRPVASPVAGSDDAGVAVKIENALSAAPSSISGQATILDNAFDDAGKFVVLRQGSNGWYCFPDIPASPGNDPQCMDQTWLDWNYAFYAGEDPVVTAPGIEYMLQGGSDPSNTDPFATEPTPGEDWVNTPPHVMLLLPEVLDPASFSTDHHSGEPYIMWAGTPYEHIMLPVTKTTPE